jgi:hypothetical protein
MDGAKQITDTPEALCKECSGKQASFLCRRFRVSDAGTKRNENPGDSRI